MIPIFVGTAYIQRLEWRDAQQDIENLPSGDIIIDDERTLCTTEDFGEAFLRPNIGYHYS